MKITQVLLALALVAMLSSCCRTQEDIWDDTKTCGRYMGCGFRSLGGKHGGSRQIGSPDEFSACYAYNDAYGVYVDDPAAEYYAVGDSNYPQARQLPGEGSIPGIEAFSDPSLHPELAAIFQNIHFDYDSSLVKGQDSVQIVQKIAAYMRSHPNSYLFLEGNTDERGPAQYNYALGSRRANSVRALLVDQNVDPNNLFTVSYGKDHPIVMEHHEDGWRQNRRVEFKIYQR